MGAPPDAGGVLGGVSVGGRGLCGCGPSLRGPSWRVLAVPPLPGIFSLRNKGDLDQYCVGTINIQLPCIEILFYGRPFTYNLWSQNSPEGIHFNPILLIWKAEVQEV